MDDPFPGLCSAKTVPKRTQQLLDAGMDEDIMWNTHSELPAAVYGA